MTASLHLARPSSVSRFEVDAARRSLLDLVDPRNAGTERIDPPIVREA